VKCNKKLFDFAVGYCDTACVLRLVARGCLL